IRDRNVTGVQTCALPILIRAQIVSLVTALGGLFLPFVGLLAVCSVAFAGLKMGGLMCSDDSMFLLSSVAAGMGAESSTACQLLQPSRNKLVEIKRRPMGCLIFVSCAVQALMQP